MKILHLANHAQLIGNGIVNMMTDLACLQAQAGHDVVVASSGGEYEALYARYGVRHVYLPQSRKLGQAVAMLGGYRRLVREFRPDIVHAHMVTGTMLARFALARRHYLLFATVHNEFQKSAELMRLADRVVAVTGVVAMSMQARGVPAHKLSVVRNGTVGSPRRIGLPPEPSPQLQRPAITTVAGMYQRKGIHDLLRAFAALPERFAQAHLYLVGDGPDRAMMEALAHELGVTERVHFTGFVANPTGYLAETDVFVNAAHREPGGLVLCEAREAGCAVVATRVDGNPEMVGGEDAALFVSAGQPPALAEAIARLLDDPAYRAALAVRGQQNLGEFSAQKVCDGYLALYDQALAEARAPRGRREAEAAAGSQRALP
jgi:glycosyltransferase involved in cell wall biosynthesis